MKTYTLAMGEVRERGMRALKRELGAAGMAQFLQQFQKGRGDYTKERHALLDKFTVDDIFAAIGGRRRTR